MVEASPKIVFKGMPKDRVNAAQKQVKTTSAKVIIK